MSDDRIDFKQIFAKSTSHFFRGGKYGGTAPLPVWRDYTFGALLTRLEHSGANAEACRQVINVIDRAIDIAPEEELSPDERTALHDMLASAFDGIARPAPTDLKPKANFLNHVKFE